MRFTILDIQYHPLPPPNDNIAVLIEDETGLLRTYINLKEHLLPTPDAWTNDMILAAAQAKLDVETPELPKISGKGHVLEFYAPPAATPPAPAV